MIWQCNGKFKGDEKCTTPHLTEDQIRDAFREAVSKLIQDRAALLEDGRLLKDALTDCTGIEKKLNEISGEMEIVAGMIESCVRENAATAQDQCQYKSRYDDLINRFETLQAKQAALQKERSERERKADALDSFLFELSELDELNMEFSPQRWNAIVDHVTVHHDGSLVFSFQNGCDVTVNI